MSPEIRVNKNLIASVPDETGIYQTLSGKRLYVDVDGINANNRKQIVILEAEEIGGKRVVGLTLEGRGSSRNTRKGGDKKEPTLDVILHDRPIRVTYSPRARGTETLVKTAQGIAYVDYELMGRVTRHNPRWTRGHGHR